MSAFVVTQTGVVIEYPTGNVLVWIDEKDYYAAIYRDKDNKGNGVGFIAKVSRGCVVSFERPSSVQQAPSVMNQSLENSLEIVAACLETIPLNYSNRKRLQLLKRKLTNYNSRSNCWKNPRISCVKLCLKIPRKNCRRFKLCYGGNH